MNKLPMICASMGTFKRSFPNSKRYFFVDKIEDLQGCDGEIFLSGSFSMHHNWPSLNELIKIKCMSGKCRVIRI